MKYYIYIFDKDKENPELIIKTKYDEFLTFYENGKVKCYNIVLSSGHFKPGQCRFLLDVINKKNSDIIIYCWNSEEKSGYFYLVGE